MRPTERDEVVHSVFIRAAPRDVYDLFASAAGLDSWFTDGATVDPRPGGAIAYRWRDWGPDRVTTVAAGTVREAVPGERFVFDWDSDDDAPTTVEMSFEAWEGGTRMRIREHGFSDGSRGRRIALREAVGWGEALTLAKMRIEHGVRY